MNEDWTFDSVPDTEVLKFQPTSSTVMVLLPTDKPGSAIIYNAGQEVGRLDISSGTFKFEGKMDESAAQLFIFIKRLVDKYLEDKHCLKDTENL